MNYWELKLALTCLVVGVATFFLFASTPDKWAHFKTNVAVLCLAAWAALLLLSLWCIWHPPQWLAGKAPPPGPPAQFEHIQFVVDNSTNALGGIRDWTNVVFNFNDDFVIQIDNWPWASNYARHHATNTTPINTPGPPTYHFNLVPAGVPSPPLEQWSH